MAHIFFDGCQFGTGDAAGWDAGFGPASYTSTGGPFSDRHVSVLSTTAFKTLGSNVSTILIGYWWNLQINTAQNVFDGRDGSTVQFRIGSNSSNQLQIRNGTAGTILGTGTTAFSTGAWRWVEWKIGVSNSATVQCKVDQSIASTTYEINVSGVDTTTTANAFITSVLSSASAAVGQQLFNCFVLWDTTGSLMNDWIGPQRASILTPTGSDTGTFNQYTASTGTRTSCVDEANTSNDDTDYISDATAGHQQSFTMTNMPFSPTSINALSLQGRMRRDDAGPRTSRLFLRNSGGTLNNQTTETLSATYVNYTYQSGVSPFTSAAWAQAEIDGLEAGVELVS